MKIGKFPRIKGICLDFELSNSTKHVSIRSAVRTGKIHRNVTILLRMGVGGLKYMMNSLATMCLHSYS